MRPKRPADSSGPRHPLIYVLLLIITEYGSSVSTKSPASGIATVSESRLTVMSLSGRKREVVCAETSLFLQSEGGGASSLTDPFVHERHIGSWNTSRMPGHSVLSTLCSSS